MGETSQLLVVCAQLVFLTELVSFLYSLMKLVT
jgi:hypothetical protein